MTLTATRSARKNDQGSALVIALLATVLLTTLGIGLVMLSNTEGAIASNYRAGSEMLYGADAAVERVVQDLLLVPRWNDILNGSLQSGFVDASTTPTAPFGGQLDLAALTADIQTQSDATAPWGPNNPQWRLFAYGPLSSMGGLGSIQSQSYVAVWIADDPSEIDNNNQADTNGVVTVLAQAYGANGTIRAVEVTVTKTDASEIERGQIAQRGQEELNQRARKAAVQLPGKSMTVSDLSVTSGGVVAR